MLRFRGATVRRPGFAATFGNELIFAVSVRTAVSARTRGWWRLPFASAKRVEVRGARVEGCALHGKVSLRQIRDPRGDGHVPPGKNHQGVSKVRE